MPPSVRLETSWARCLVTEPTTGWSKSRCRRLDCFSRRAPSFLCCLFPDMSGYVARDVPAGFSVIEAEALLCDHDPPAAPRRTGDHVRGFAGNGLVHSARPERHGDLQIPANRRRMAGPAEPWTVSGATEPRDRARLHQPP